MARLLIRKFHPRFFLLLPFSLVALSCGGDGASSSPSDSALEQKISELETQIQQLSDTTLPNDGSSSSEVAIETEPPTTVSSSQLTASNSTGSTTPRVGTSTSQPVTARPVTTQPVTTQARTTQPATTQPATTQPATTQPATTQPRLVCPSGSISLGALSLTVASSFADYQWPAFTYYTVRVEGTLTNNTNATLGFVMLSAQVAYSPNMDDFYRTPSPTDVSLYAETSSYKLAPGATVRVRGSGYVNGSSTYPVIQSGSIDYAAWDDPNFLINCPSP